MNLEGVVIPPTQPFVDDEVSLDLLAGNIVKWNKTGISGYLILGSTSEFVFLNERERLSVVEAARKVIPKEKLMIVGIAMESARSTIEFAAKVVDQGADYALCVTPHYFKAAMTPSALADFFKRVADSISIPLILYNIPQCTGVTLDSDTVAALSEHENIVGVKDSSGNFVQLTRIRERVPPPFKVLVGHGELLLSALHIGADGAILAIANLAPEFCVDIYEAFRAEDLDTAVKKQRTLSNLVERLIGGYGVPGIKAAMGMRGFAGGQPRSPLIPLTESDRVVLKSILEDAALL